MMQDEWQFCLVCVYIMEGGHFSISDADANPRMTGLALITVCALSLSFDEISVIARGTHIYPRI